MGLSLRKTIWRMEMEDIIAESLESLEIGTEHDIETEDDLYQRQRNAHWELGDYIRHKSQSNPESSESCIYLVPENVRKITEEDYTPRVVSIGPFHCFNSRFRYMEAYKVKYFQKFLGREYVILRNLIRVVMDDEKIIRDSYAEDIYFSLPLILVDGCFITELLLSSVSPDLQDRNDPILLPSSIGYYLIHDLILLENQIPFFVLEKLFSQLWKRYSFLSLACSFFKKYNLQEKQPNFTAKHFTDLIRILHLPIQPRSPPRDDGEFVCLYSATQLHEVGVEFRVGSSTCLFDIQFINGVLEIPRLKLEDGTKSWIRNVMAMEFSHYPNESYMIDYIFFMDNLINTSKDVDLLVQNGILGNWLGDSNAAAAFFNNISTNVPIMSANFRFSHICKQLNTYYRIPRHAWTAVFKREYLSTPWRTASIIAAIILLLLTATQTVCSIIALKP